MQAADQLLPSGDALWDALSRVHYLQADETPVKVLKPNKKAYMWLYHSPQPGKRFVVFDFSLTRSGETADKRLEHFTGLLQTDGYSGYNTQRKRDEVITFGCWDHVRRKFKDVIKAAGNNKSGKAGQVLKKIGKLYKLERLIKDLSPEERQAIRQEKAKPLLDSIKEFVDKINAPPTSLLGKAVTYCKNQWEELIRYIDHGEVHLSNILAENQVRPFALGRKNWLFIGNERSAQRAALLYSLVQSCIMNDINPYHCVVYALKQVHKMRRREVNPEALLPHNIDKELLS